MGTSKPGYGYRSLTFQQCNLAHSRHILLLQKQYRAQVSSYVVPRGLRNCGSTSRDNINNFDLGEPGYLVKVFISQKSLSFLKSCRQRVIFAVLVLFFAEFAMSVHFPVVAS